MPRVIAGSVRGRKLEAPKGVKTRPTTDRIKETIFNVINFSLPGAVVLDLFAGSGSLGIEALSRGAEKAVFCDLQRQTSEIVQRNIDACGLSEKAEVYCADYIKALNALHKRNMTFDVIFLDPPYAKGMLTDAIRKIYEHGILSEGGLIVAEMSAEEEFEPDCYHIRKTGDYGQTKVAYIVNETEE